MKEREIILVKFGRIGHSVGFLSEPDPDYEPKFPYQINEMIAAWRTNRGGFNHETGMRAAYPDLDEYYDYLRYNYKR